MHKLESTSPRVTYDPATELFSIWACGELVFRSDNMTEIADHLDWIDFSEEA